MEYLVPAYGGVAQLGEHLLCKQGVKGSTPLSSTRIEAIQSSFIDTIKEMRYRLCVYNRVCIAEKESK